MGNSFFHLFLLPLRDAFSQIRSVHEEKLNDIQSRCLICGIESGVFDRDAYGFFHHLTFEHHQWDYLDLYIRIRSREERFV